jgi:hypothetical protein
MGGLVGGLFDLFSGDPAEQEQKQFGALGNYQTGVGEGLTTAGAGEELGILSGDPTKIAQVEAPEISAQQGQIEGQRLQGANFGTRSGGTAAATENAESAGRGNLIDLTGNLIGNTASTAVGQGSNLLGEASSNIGNEAQLAEERRKQLNQDVGGVASGAAQIAEAFLPQQQQEQQEQPSENPDQAQASSDIAASQNNWGQGPEPGYTDWSGIDQSGPNMSVFDSM